MKRNLSVLLIGILLSLGFVGLTQTSASAASCGSQQHKAATIDMGWWKHNAYLYYRNCTTDGGTKYVQIDKYQIQANRPLDGCGQVVAVEGNPDGIGGWNPGGKLMSCWSGDSVYVLTWWAPDDHRIWASDNLDAKCMSASVTLHKVSDADDYTKTMPGLCVQVPW